MAVMVWWCGWGSGWVGVCQGCLLLCWAGLRCVWMCWPVGRPLVMCSVHSACLVYSAVLAAPALLHVVRWLVRGVACC